MERRQFLKKSCTFCLALGGVAGLVTMLDGCSNLLVVQSSVADKRISVLKSQLTGHDMAIVKVNGYGANLALVQEGSQMTAFILQCTHAEYPLVFDGKNFICNQHGSNFTKHGQVVNGPARFPLNRLKVEDDGDYYRILI